VLGRAGLAAQARRRRFVQADRLPDLMPARPALGLLALLERVLVGGVGIPLA
jgi:hypothetical protein